MRCEKEFILIIYYNNTKASITFILGKYRYVGSESYLAIQGDFNLRNV